MLRESTPKAALPADGPQGKRSSGRPRKFREPSRAVTVTLPQRTLEALHKIDSDRARAIARVVDGVVSGWRAAEPHVEVREMRRGTGLIVVPPQPSLDGLAWMKMIQIAPARYLLVIEPGTPIEKVEVSLTDLTDDAKRSRPDEVPVLEAIRTTFADLRRAGRVTKWEVLLVDVEQ
jgi:hypothetical protein